MTTKTDFAEALTYSFREEDFERARQLLGRDEPCREQEHVGTATLDSIRNFAAGCGHDNPLFSDPDYAAKTRWGSVIAPTMMAGIINTPMRGEADPEIRTLRKGLFKGIHLFMSGSTWDFYRPIYPGDSIYSFRGEESIDIKTSEFAGRSVIRVRRDVKVNQRAEVVAVYRTLWVLTERKASAEKKKYDKIAPPHYSDEDFAKIEAIYAAETVRGSEKRPFESVAVGEQLPLFVRGPLTVTDMICFHATGHGFVPYGISTGQLAHQNRKRIPAFYVKNEHGVPDVAQRVHWDNDWAKGIGNPAAYDYGVLRENYVFGYLCAWAGDDGIVLHVHDEIRKFNYMGDVQYITGEVTGVRQEGGAGLVDIAVKMVNQRDEQTVIANATVALPTATGPAIYPEVPQDLKLRAVAMMERHWAARSN